MLEWIHSPEAWIALATLVALEIVLGIDNIIFISILVGRLPAEQRNLGRRLGARLVTADAPTKLPRLKADEGPHASKLHVALIEELKVKRRIDRYAEAGAAVFLPRPEFEGE